MLPARLAAAAAGTVSWCYTASSKHDWGVAGGVGRLAAAFGRGLCTGSRANLRPLLPLLFPAALWMPPSTAALMPPSLMSPTCVA